MEQNKQLFIRDLKTFASPCGPKGHHHPEMKASDIIAESKYLKIIDFYPLESCTDIITFSRVNIHMDKYDLWNFTDEQIMNYITSAFTNEIYKICEEYGCDSALVLQDINISLSDDNKDDTIGISADVQMELKKTTR